VFLESMGLKINLQERLNTEMQVEALAKMAA
jgi:hypothetical protein